MSVYGRVAVITGAASGIGLALTKSCLEKGYHVVMADNAVSQLCDQVELLSIDSEPEVMGIVCDVANGDSVKHLAKQTMDRFGRVDCLFNNAGISGHFLPVWELTQEHIRKVMDVNVFGVLHGIQAFLPYMFKQKHTSHIINIASIYGLISGSHVSAYSMSKHAVLALSESLHFDLQRLHKPVQVSIACPSFANTSLLSNSAPLHTDSLHHMFNDLIARSRPAEEVAEHILNEMQKGVFYILPDKEAKEYCQQRAEAIAEQTKPSIHSLEKLIASLSKRAEKQNTEATTQELDGRI